MDMFVVPPVSFRLLYGLLILRHARRELLWLGVTAHPSAQWIAQQLTEAYGWKETPRYLIRDRDSEFRPYVPLGFFPGQRPCHLFGDGPLLLDVWLFLCRFFRLGRLLGQSKGP